MWDNSVEYIVPCSNFKSLSLQFKPYLVKNQDYTIHQIGEFYKDANQYYLLKNEILPIFTLTSVALFLISESNRNL